VGRTILERSKSNLDQRRTSSRLYIFFRFRKEDSFRSNISHSTISTVQSRLSVVLLRHGLSSTRPSMVLVSLLQVLRNLLDNHLPMDSNRYSKHSNSNHLGYVPLSRERHIKGYSCFLDFLLLFGKICVVVLRSEVCYVSTTLIFPISALQGIIKKPSRNSFKISSSISSDRLSRDSGTRRISTIALLTTFLAPAASSDSCLTY